MTTTTSVNQFVASALAFIDDNSDRLAVERFQCEVPTSDGRSYVLTLGVTGGDDR